MLTTFNEAYKTWIFAKNAELSDLPVARLLDFVINPETGIFEALWVTTKNGFRLIAVKAILRWNSDEILISDENEILKPDEFPRLKKILDKEVAILGARVFLNKKNYIGKVINFAFDSISPRVLSIHVRSGIWIFGKKRIIPRSRISKITKKGIFIEDTPIKSMENNTIIPEKKTS